MSKWFNLHTLIVVAAVLVLVRFRHSIPVVGTAITKLVA